MRTKVKAPTTSTDEGIMFVVLRLNEKIAYIDPVSNKPGTVKLGGCRGYLPVFGTIEEAEKASCAGRFQIFAIKEVKES